MYYTTVDRKSVFFIDCSIANDNSRSDRCGTEECRLLSSPLAEGRHVVSQWSFRSVTGN